MKKYQVEFTGRRKDAQGIDYRIFINVEAENIPAARLKLYEWFDHIMFDQYTEVEEFVKNSVVL